VTTIRTSSSGETPLALENPIEEFQLVPTLYDAMRTSPLLDLTPNVGDSDMLKAHRPETFMGKEGCDEDVAESAVDLDGETAIQMDAAAEKREATELSVAQMNVQIQSKTSVMPDSQ